MTAPASIGFSSLAATAGQTNVWKLKFPSRCHINQLIVHQVAGAGSAFGAQLFSSSKPFDEYGSGSSGGPTPPGEDPNPAYQMDPAAYHVGDEIQGNGSGHVHRIWEDGLAYANADGFARERFIYLAITPSGSGSKVYDVSFIVTK